MVKSVADRIVASPRLPTLPGVALRILDINTSRSINMHQVAEIIRHDQALSAKVLRTVNSSFYSLTQPCGSIQQAIVFLGMNAVKSLVLSFSLIDSINGLDSDGVSFDFLDYWKRGLFCAAAAREISRYAQGVESEEAFLAALMQDIGMVACHRAIGDRYLQVIDLTDGDHSRLVNIEQRCFGCDHAQVGAKLAQRWRLPQHFVDAILAHHDSSKASTTALVMAQVLELAGMAAAAFISPQPDDVLGRFTHACREWLRMTGAQVKFALHEIASSTKELSQLVEMPIGDPPQIDVLLERAEHHLMQHLAAMSGHPEPQQPKQAA